MFEESKDIGLVKTGDAATNLPWAETIALTKGLCEVGRRGVAKAITDLGEGKAGEAYELISLSQALFSQPTKYRLTTKRLKYIVEAPTVRTQLQR